MRDRRESFRARERSPRQIPETDAIFENISLKDQREDGQVKRLSLDCKATVKIGDYSREGKTRGQNQAQDHDMGATEKYIPCVINIMNQFQSLTLSG